MGAREKGGGEGRERGGGGRDGEKMKRIIK